jgi:hypothetical protein
MLNRSSGMRSEQIYLPGCLPYCNGQPSKVWKHLCRFERTIKMSFQEAQATRNLVVLGPGQARGHLMESLGCFFVSSALVSRPLDSTTS